MSSCSFEQDENISKQFQKTPGTPVKVTHQTLRTSSKKRSLFQPSSPLNSPSRSDDLGPMSPLSASSDDSYLTPQSPCFSPNGRYSISPKTPFQCCPEERYSRRKGEISFPSLKLDTPKSHKALKPLRRSERLTPKKSITENSVEAESIVTDVTTPTRSFRRTNKSRRFMSDCSQINSSQDSYDTTPCRNRSSIDSAPVSTFGIRTISSESFYGSLQPTSKPRTQLFIDTLGSKATGRRTRSLSVDSVSSNRSFVTGLAPGKKRKVSDTSGRSERSKRGRQKGPYPGVWHGVKKPKTMKFAKNSNKPLISPNSNPIQLKSKRYPEEKLRVKNASGKEETSASLVENEILDSFPHHLIKRKKLPSHTHPSGDMQLKIDTDAPDPNKKFFKHKRTKAILTINSCIKLQYWDGALKLQSPKKKRKLYSIKSEMNFDFENEDIQNAEVKENIENILLRMEVEKGTDAKKNVPEVVVTSPKKNQITVTSDDQLVSVVNSPGTKINLVKGSPSKVLTEIHNDLSDTVFVNVPLATDQLRRKAENLVNSITKKHNETGLGETGNILSSTRNILSNPNITSAYPLSEEDENLKSSKEKFFSLFYKQNWNSLVPAKDTTAVKNSNKKKSMKIPDDQYLLDAGQKSVGIVTCGKCGVMYQAGDFADEATHKNFHDHLPELRFTGWANERVVGRDREGRMIMILSSDSKSWWHKVSKIIDIVDQELGFPEGSVNALFYKTVYLYINNKAKQIVGCLVAEECKEAYKMFPPLEGVDVDSCSKDPSPCKVGISRIWTALNYRRRGVAKRMIDCMRRNFIFGEVVPIDMIAFSAPSPSGKLLAQNVTGKLDFLVYGFD